MLLNITYFMSAKDSNSGCQANMAGTLLTEPYPQIVDALVGFMNLRAQVRLKHYLERQTIYTLRVESHLSKVSNQKDKPHMVKTCFPTYKCEHQELK